MRPWFALLAVAPLALAACDRKKPAQPQAEATAPAAPEGHQVDRAGKGRPISAMPLTGPTGAPATLASLRGRPVLVNLWATWCAPCVRELPQLDAIAARGDLVVASVNEDMEGAAAVRPFLARHPLAALKPWTDKANRLLATLGEGGLPVTILYDAAGREVWRVRGGLDWTGAEARALLAEAAPAS